MLVDLKALEVIVGHTNGYRGEDSQCAASSLSLKRTTGSPTGNHKCTGITGKDEKNNDIAVNAVEDE